MNFQNKIETPERKLFMLLIGRGISRMNINAKMYLVYNKLVVKCITLKLEDEHVVMFVPVACNYAASEIHLTLISHYKLARKQTYSSCAVSG